MRRIVVAIALLTIIGGLVACAGKPVRCTAPEDNPQHHYLMGMEALEVGKMPEAKSQFERSVWCNDEYGPGFAGLAIVGAASAKGQTDSGFRAAEIERVKEQLDKSRKFAGGDEDLFDYQLARLRSAPLIKEKNWLAGAEDAENEAQGLKVNEAKLLYYQEKEAAPYFMGMAYLEALEFSKAGDQFKMVLNARRDGKWHEKADQGIQRVDRIVRAMAGMTVGDVGKRIAVKDRVDRGDLAALLIDELKIDKLLAGPIPVASQLAKQQPEFTPADILSNPFKSEILIIMKWKVRGLEPKYDETTKAYLFFPDEPVTRGELALILEDVLIKLTGDEKLACAYLGENKSPFPDVRPTSPYFNAVLNVTTRGIMAGDLSGEFRVNTPTDGAEALLAVRSLKLRAANR